MNKNLFSINPEIEGAIAAHRAVVALESTVIAHGLPRPQNLETAQRLEQIVRAGGLLQRRLPCSVESSAWG